MDVLHTAIEVSDLDATRAFYESASNAHGSTRKTA